MRYVYTFMIILLITVSSGLVQEQIVSLSATDSLLAEDYEFRQIPSIAVLPFYDANAQAKEVEFGRTVSAMLATALRSNTNFIVVEGGELTQILSEKNIGMTGITQQIARSIADLYDVEVILSGDVSLINTTLHIDVRLIETSKSGIVVALYSTCQDLTNIRVVVEDLAGQLEQSYLRQWMGRISIISEPAGAEVYLQNKYIGRTDPKQPLQVGNLLEGNYQLKFIRGGYYDWEGTVAVLAKMERSVKVSLIAKPGSMNIYSAPAGAQIFVDNNSAGLTPMSLKKVAEGEHEIRLVKDKYKVWAQRVMVRSFQPTDVKATLEVSPGFLTINSIPDEAMIFFKGKYVGNTPFALADIKPGEVVVHVEKEGYEPWTTSAQILPDMHKTLDVVLKEKKGAFTLSSNPEGALVYMQGQNLPGKKLIGHAPILHYETTIGTYSLEVEKEDYFTEEKTINIEYNKLTTIEVDLEEKPGSILVSTDPQNARIFLICRISRSAIP